MPLQQLFTSRKPYNASAFVAHEGKLFYDEATGYLRLGDGVTPGGKIVGNLAIAATGTTAPINPYEGELWYNPNTLELWAYHNGSFRGTINPATTTTLGGIIVGPGISVSDTGLLTLDAADLPVSFGHFYANDNNLSTVNANEDFNILSNGTGSVNLTGSFNVFDAQGVFGDQPILRVQSDGQIRMLVPLADMNTGALEIIGNTSGASLSPNQTGVILHVTGNDGLVSRNYFDASNNYALLVGRRYNGTATDVTKVLNGEMFFRIAGQASNDVGFETFGPVQIDWVATQDQTPTAQGGELRIRATPNNTSSVAGGVIVATFNATTGLTATKFNGPLAGNVLATTVTATNFVGTLQTAAQPNITSVGTLTNLTVTGRVTANTGTFTTMSGKLVRAVRNAGTIGAGGTLTIDFSTDAIVHCTWSTGLIINYQNYQAGSVVRVIATKASGSGTGSISLDGITPTNVSNGSATTGNYASDTTAFVEFTCVGTTIASVYAKL